jgi:hypothetical protein
LISQIATSSLQHAAVEDDKCIRSQIATGSSYGGRRYLTCVFTEHGTIMDANVLNSPPAVQISPGGFRDRSKGVIISAAAE